MLGQQRLCRIWISRRAKRLFVWEQHGTIKVKIQQEKRYKKWCKPKGKDDRDHFSVKLHLLSGFAMHVKNKKIFTIQTKVVSV